MAYSGSNSTLSKVPFQCLFILFNMENTVKAFVIKEF